ncbi:MAG: hypothetical protein Q7S05_02920 [bacterium]|nr:hypothetical protein [bacterium]
MRVSAERETAFRLRMTGHSYNEICARLSIPKSTLRTWFSDLVLSDYANARLKARIHEGSYKGLLKRSKMQTHLARKRAMAARGIGELQIPKISTENLKLIGAALYWAEGYKRLKVKDGKERMSHTISFVNADADMVRIFLKFLKEILLIPDEKIRLCMRLYEHINEGAALRFWMGATRFPKENFHKSTYLTSLSSKHRKPFNRLPHGTLQIEVCNTSKFHYLLGLIDGVKKQI